MRLYSHFSFSNARFFIENERILYLDANSEESSHQFIGMLETHYRNQKKKKDHVITNSNIDLKIPFWEIKSNAHLYIGEKSCQECIILDCKHVHNIFVYINHKQFIVEYQQQSNYFMDYTESKEIWKVHATTLHKHYFEAYFY